MGSRRSFIVRHALLTGALLFLVGLAWQALSGAWRQVTRARTPGQKIETGSQAACGLLSLLVVLTCFRGRRHAARVRRLWGVSLAASAGLSALVWGPPMPPVALLFVAISLVVARVLAWSLRTAGCQ